MNPGARFEVTRRDGFAFLTDRATGDPRISVEARTLAQGPPPLTIQQALDGSRFSFAGDRMLRQAAAPGAPPAANLETRRIDGWDVLVDKRAAKILDRRYVAEDETLGRFRACSDPLPIRERRSGGSSGFEGGWDRAVTT